jgi:hypothetical protein
VAQQETLPSGYTVWWHVPGQRRLRGLCRRSRSLARCTGLGAGRCSCTRYSATGRFSACDESTGHHNIHLPLTSSCTARTCDTPCDTHIAQCGGMMRVRTAAPSLRRILRRRPTAPAQGTAQADGSLHYRWHADASLHHCIARLFMHVSRRALVYFAVIIVAGRCTLRSQYILP